MRPRFINHATDEKFAHAKQLQGKQAEFIVLPGAGHLIRRHHADVVRQILLRQVTFANNR